MTPIAQRIEELLSQMTLKEKVSLLSGKDIWNTVPIERLGIPSITMTDGPHGVRAPAEAGRITGDTTAFPTGVSMAASWNPTLIERVGAALGEETRGMGCDILLGPCVNIVRHPLAGRNFEAYSEDPFLNGRIGVAWVNGLQSRGVGASLKHYACNNQEIERMRGNSVVDERTLREIYLPHFETVVKEANPWTVMCSYNRINGVYASQHHYLLTEILRSEWGFDGVVVSDWTANHTIFESVQGGLDLEMPGPATYYGRLLEQAVHNWQIDEIQVDNAVRRVLRLIFKTGKMNLDLQEAAGETMGISRPEMVNTPEHQALARELAEEAITLLKNENNVLPLKIEQLESMAIIGPNAAAFRVGGGGSSFVEPAYEISPLAALKTSMGERVEICFEQGCDNYAELPVLESEYLTPPAGEGHGLRGEYFANADLSGQPAMERLDPNVNRWFFFTGPAEDIPIQKFSIRWTGKLTVPESGSYTLELGNTHACRLYLDGELLIDHTRTGELSWSNLDVRTSQQIELTAGRVYDLRVEFIKATDEPIARIKLMLARLYQSGEDQRIPNAAALAAQSEVAIVFTGMPVFFESEGGDRRDMELPGPQVELIRAVAKANPKTVVVLNAGAPVAMPWLDQVAAVVNMFYPGVEGANAVTRVLVGEVNPSGKLPVTFPKRLEDTPAFINYPGAKNVHYGEGIFVGYRYYDMRDIEPLFPFGHGLSYTTFEYRDLQAPAQVKPGEAVTVSVEVKNTGQAAGKEVVQLYVHDRESTLLRPPKELKGFEKVSLQPGESKTVYFVLDQRALSFYDPDRKQWVAEPGEFEVLVGSSSRDIRTRAVFRLE